MSAGQRDRQIVIQVATTSQDETGEELLDWTDDLTLWAQWFPGNTRESHFARQQAQLAAKIDGVFHVPFIPEPDPKLNRIVWEGRIFNMLPAMEIGRGRGWEIPVVASGEAVV